MMPQQNIPAGSSPSLHLFQHPRSCAMYAAATGSVAFINSFGEYSPTSAPASISADIACPAAALRHVVRHDHDRFPQPPLEILKFACISAARQRIERAERLVHQQNRRIGGQRSRHAHALPLASGKLVRIAMQKFLRVQTRPAATFRSTRARMRSSGHSPAAAPAKYFAPRCNAGKARLPESRTRCAAAARSDPTPASSAVDQHRAFARLQQPVDHLERRGFSRAAAPQQHQRLAALHHQT